MEAMSDYFKKSLKTEDFTALAAEIRAYPVVAAFIAEHQLTEAAISRSLAKFYEYSQESERFAQMPIADYEPILLYNEGYADVAYRPTAALLKKQAAALKRNNVQLVGLPTALKSIRWSAVRLDDTKRAKVYQLIANAITNYPIERGLYLYGDFGIGKSFMLAAMANELADKGVATTLIHYPSFISEGSLEDIKNKANELKRAPVLVLDDIGAEFNNAWLRDNVLQIILQYRMDNQLLTFFSSNLSMQELEAHLAETRTEKDIWPAKRVMERIKFLSEEIHLEGVNRRHD